jgi:REP element-mobilizing transposase RayT
MPIVDDDFDRKAFFRFLSDVIARLDWSCLAFCLMTNHYHLLIRTPEPDLPIGMHRLNFLHAYRFNRRHGYKGHLFERRYFAELVRNESQLVATAQYIELNPVRAGIASSPETWSWSSCAAILGLTEAPSWFDPSAVLSLLGDDVARARVSYALRLHDGARSRRVPLPGRGTPPF